jgi:hypothetical protein
VNVPISALPRTEPSLPGSGSARSVRHFSCFSCLQLAALLGLAACASAPTRAALTGDLTSLKAAVSDAEGRGELGHARVRELAAAVLRRELVSLHAPDARFPELRPCATNIRGVLEDVAAGASESAAPASVALIDAGSSPPGPRADVARSPVLRARQAVGEAAGTTRRAFMLHGDAEVRRAALAAALDTADPADVPALLEAARLDPDLEARASAVRALGRVGGVAVVLGLADVWPSAPPEQRRYIAEAWATPASFVAGGERELVSIVEAESSVPATFAALLLADKAAGPAGLTTAALLRAMRGADSERRLLAVAASPWSDAELRAAILALSSSEDPATRVLALLRRVEHALVTSEDLAALRKLSVDAQQPVAPVARAVLARAGDASVKPGLESDLGLPRANQRTLAAVALILLEEWSAAAHALADDSPEVRRAVACQVLSEPELASARGQGGLADSRPFGPLAPDVVALLLPAPP